ncbi:MAG: CPBP family intramembrane metalloprotease [Chloroflexi bacterium]|nr:CPBP family intramembrane metalloprotease [Chloroflexota bacterium]
MPWGSRDLLFATLLAGGVGLGSSVALGIAVALVVPRHSLPTEGVVLVALVLEVALGAAAWFFSVRRYRCSWSLLGLGRRLGPRDVLWIWTGLVAGLGINLGYARLLEVMGWSQLLPPPPPLPIEAGSPGLLMTALLVSLVAPVSEEMFFRGFLFGGLASRHGLWRAALLSSLLFALFHLDPRTLLPVFLLGVLLAGLYVRTRTLWAPVFVHLGYNSTMLLVLVESAAQGAAT